jgi:hypothetical protein
MHQRCVVVCDEDATLELRVRTVRYFKGLEKVHETMLGDADLLHSGGVDLKAHNHAVQEEKGSLTSAPVSASTLQDESSSDSRSYSSSQPKRKLSAGTNVELSPATEGDPKRPKASM